MNEAGPSIILQNDQLRIDLVESIFERRQDEFCTWFFVRPPDVFYKSGIHCISPIFHFMTTRTLRVLQAVGSKSF